MCDRRIASVSDILDRVKFSTKDSCPSELDKLLYTAFQVRFRRWLCGKGHPAQLRGKFIGDELFTAEEHDPLARARCFLHAASDLDLIPLSPSLQFKVCSLVITDPVQSLAHSIQIVLNVPSSENSLTTAVPPPIAFHTCDTRMVVTIDTWVQNALREPCTLNDDDATAFDLWIHTQMILTEYNRT